MSKVNLSIRVLIAVLLLQAVGLLAISRKEEVPKPAALDQFPTRIGGWKLSSVGVVEKEVQDVLKADDLLTRSYTNPAYAASTNLFIAYFLSQRTGKAPHSPKNCLPGSGWAPSLADKIAVTPASGGKAIPVNRYLVTRGDATSVVLYWYQSRNRAVASEYLAKIYLVLDSIRYHRSDTALVRIVVPVIDGDDQQASKEATDFAALVADGLSTLVQFQGS